MGSPISSPPPGSTIVALTSPFRLRRFSEAKKAEERLRRSEAYLAEAQRLSHTGSFGWTPSTGDLHWSDETFRILEYDSSVKPTMERVVQRIHPDDLAIVRQVIDEASRGNEVDITHRLLMPDGSVKVVHVLGHALKDAVGNLEIIGAVMDVTERKRTEEALRESEANFRDYAETASDWFWEIGSDYKFTLLTENAFGSRAAARIGTACWDHALDLESEPEKWRLVRATLDSRKPFRDFVYRGLSGNGSPMYVKASGKPVFDANGEFHGYRGTGTDVTALMCAQEERGRLRQLEADLAHMNRLSMMGELAASLAHEIKQPIAAARTYASAATRWLDRRQPDVAEAKKALANIADSANRASSIIDRIQDNIKKAPLRKTCIDLSGAIDEVIGLARSAITNNGVSVQTRLVEGSLAIHGDRVQLQQVLLNLILNAVEAMASVEVVARELLISTERDHTGVRVAVRDSGPGIDATQLERVFEAFYTTKSGGTGMGLSICRSIIDAHGGKLWAEANEPRGAVFQFTLPAAQEGS